MSLRRACAGSWMLCALAPALACTADRRDPSPPPASVPVRGTGPARAPLVRVPSDYVLIGAKGTVARERPPSDPSAGRSSAGAGTPLGPGFGYVVSDHRTVGGIRYLQIHDGRWLPASDVVPARPSAFAGVALAPGSRLDFAWVVAPETVVREAPTPAARALASRARTTRLAPTGPCVSGWCPLLVGWVKQADLAFPAAISTRPRGVGPTDRWIDVDLSSQVLLACEGDRPVYATLVSTGIGEPGSPFATPTGTFRIRSKHELVRMDNLEHTGVVPYAYDVPLAQYFADGKALHAALWHDRFGQPTSHGCINLSPRDAEWLYAFTDAPLTAVRVHGDPPLSSLAALRSTPRAGDRNHFRF